MLKVPLKVVVQTFVALLFVVIDVVTNLRLFEEIVHICEDFSCELARCFPNK